MPLPLDGLQAPWVTLDTLWLKQHLGIVVALMLAGAGAGLLGFAYLLVGRRRTYQNNAANDVLKAERAKEYGLYIAAFSLLGLGMLAGAAASALLMNTKVLATTIGSTVVFPGWVNAVTGFVQFNILIGKALLFCWLFVWVRWTLPRFRYDQIMALGWKVMLNIALVNLLATAVIAKLVR
jgi:NADH-quinone oxidoreductase subunit H